MNDIGFFALLVASTLCSPIPEKDCIQYSTVYIQEEPVLSGDKEEDAKFCTKLKTFVMNELKSQFPDDWSISNQECTTVVPYVSDNIVRYMGETGIKEATEEELTEEEEKKNDE